MGLATLLGASKGPIIGGVQIDVSVRETHRSSSEVTDHAIELGADISDHVRRLPDEVTLEGIVSDLPTNLLELGGIELSGETAQKRYDDLIRIVEFADTFDLITGLRTYSDMVFTRFEVDRDETTGKIIRFRADMKQLRFATSEEVAVIVADETDTPKAAPETDVGPKKPPPASPAAATGMVSTLKTLGSKASASSFGQFFKGLIGI